MATAPQSDVLIEIQGRIIAKAAEIARLETEGADDIALDKVHDELGDLLDEFYDPEKWAKP